ncbi:hypothetical protein ACXYTJ_15385 [Gilvimarinus sp. F26214L]|uniref:hypothetical protein n=1 Tax=Gilvimarinus sp. DZF01 TaxID=3461371 RepID=UPI004045B67E
MDGWFYWAFMVSMMATFISWLLFGRSTMARIEHQIKKDGLDRPCPWDGPGARIVWYAWAIALPIGRLNRKDDPFIDVPLVRRYSNGSDRVVAIFMVISSGAFLAIGVVGSFL